VGINHLSGRTGGREGTDGRSTLFMVGKRNDSKCYIRAKDSDSHKIGIINKNMNSTYHAKKDCTLLSFDTHAKPTVPRDGMI